MKILAPRLETFGSKIRALSRVEWEDSDRPPGDVSFETESEAAEGFEAAAEAFTVLCALSARRKGERRIRVEAPFCPRLRDGLDRAFQILEAWFPNPRRRPPPRIESPRGVRARLPPSPRAAAFVSGGLDSIGLILDNRRDYSPGHPRFFRDGIFLCGVTRRPETPVPHQEDLIRRQRRCVEELCRFGGLRLLPVSIDPDVLDEDRLFVRTQGHGARLAAAAHMFGFLSTVSIASSFFVGDLFPWGSHPLLDTCFSSGSLEVRHDGIGRRRLELVQALARRKEVLKFLMVCSEGPVAEGAVNCGRCEKCVRTMLELEIAGVLTEAESFPSRRMRAEDIDAIPPPEWSLSFWRELAEPLRAKGRRDLDAAVARLLQRGARHRDWIEERGVRGRMRRFDRELLGGRIFAARRFLGDSRRRRSK